MAIKQLDVPALRAQFPVFERRIHGNRLVYLDSGASAQMPQQVIETIDEYRRHHHANVHRSVYLLAEEATTQYESARKTIASFLNASSTREVLFGKNVTEMLNLVARTWGQKNLQRGDVIVLTKMEHHANLVPWLMLAEEKQLEIRYVDIAQDGLLDMDNIDVLLRDAKLFAFTAVSNVLGTLNPVQQLAAAARAAGAVSVVDGAQWVPHFPVNVQTIGADFVGFTGHKILGPTGIGVLWGREALLQEMPPFLGGGDMIADVRLDGFTPNELPWKFEAGTPPIAEAIGLGEAIRFISQLGMESVREHERDLTNFALEHLRSEIDTLKVYGPLHADLRGGVVSFELEGVHPHDVGQVLGQDGVCVRAGHHCAKPLHRLLGVAASVRASFSVYNDRDDIIALAQSLKKARDMFA